MSWRIDDGERRLSLSVGDFVSDQEFHRIGFDRGDGLARLRIGQAIHSAYQDRRMAEVPGYRREVTFRFEIPAPAGWTVALFGRIDGLATLADGSFLVEEIKSTSFALDRDRSGMSASKKLRAMRQLGVYCHGLSHQGGAEPAAAGPKRLIDVRGLLVFVDIASGEIRNERLEVDAAEMSAWMRARAAALVDGLHAQRERLREQRRAADTVAFPHAVPRPGQEELIGTTARALAEGEVLLASAPTGIGKTAATLYPALRAALAKNRKLVILTAKTLQQPLAMETLARMQPGPWTAVRLRAKKKMCANGRVICHEDFCRFAKDYPEKMEGSGLASRLLESSSILEPERIYDEAVACEVCPFEVSLEMADRAEVVVADYNYVFDPDVALGWTREPGGLERALLVVDEAHNLVDRAREIHSPLLAVADLVRAIDFAGSRSGEDFASLAEAFDRVRRLVEAHAEDAIGEGEDGSQRVLIPVEPFDEIALELEQQLAIYLAWKRETLSYEEDDPVLDAFFAVLRFHRLAALVGDDLIPLAGRDRGRAFVRLLCLDPARFLAPVWERAAGAVLLSATLSPFDFYRQLLGLPAGRAAEIQVPSPFPPENRRVLVIPSVSTTFRRRELDAARTARLISEMAAAIPGNVLALFPSYSYLEMIVERMDPVPQSVVVQRPDLPESERAVLLAALSDAPANGTFMAAVTGGLFAEGVDYPGETLRAVFVVSPALPRVTPEQEMLRTFYEERYGSGFDYAYLIPGLRRVVQSAGRVVRSETDRGLVALICRRFALEQYRRYLPPEWFSSDRPSTLPAGRAIRAARDFFGEVAPDE